MKNDLAICLLLIGLFIATLLLAGQRDYGLESINTRIELVERQVGHGNIPRITVTGRTSVYAGEHQVTVVKK